MHTIRYIIGDEIFFPTLKMLATAPQYTYHNLVSTNDVEALFSKASGQDLKPVFNLFLRTINKLDISIKQTSENEYQIRLVNYVGTLPIDIQTETGLERKMIDQEGIKIISNTVPVADPKVYYLKRVILE